MATSCLILFEDPNQFIGSVESNSADLFTSKVKFYQHYDSQPERMMPILEKFAKDFIDARGYYDPSYMLAQLSYKLIELANQEFAKYKIPISYNGFGLITGYKLVDYVYLFKEDGTVHLLPSW